MTAMYTNIGQTHQHNLVRPFVNGPLQSIVHHRKRTRGRAAAVETPAPKEQELDVSLIKSNCLVLLLHSAEL